MNTPKKHDAATVEQQETAALAALDLAPPSEAASVPRQLVTEMREAAWLLAESVTPVAPAPSLKNRLLSRVAQFEQLKPLADVRRNEEYWASTGMPGVDVKQLFQENETGRSTYLLLYAARRLFTGALSPRCGTVPGAQGRHRLGRFGLRGRRLHRDGKSKSTRRSVPSMAICCY
jgi:hypothetical protein